MDSINVDIIGLQATLQLLQQYYQNGMLQAEIGLAFRMHGPCVACVEIKEGQIVSCFIQDKLEQRQATKIEVLLRLDLDEGPFTWRFHPLEQSKALESSATKTTMPLTTTTTLPIQRSPQMPQQSTASQFTFSAVPRRLANLDLNWLTTWSPQQKRILRMVYAMVDGRRSVAMIESSVLSSKATVQEALVILIAMHVITIDH